MYPCLSKEDSMKKWGLSALMLSNLFVLAGVAYVFSSHDETRSLASKVEIGHGCQTIPQQLPEDCQNGIDEILSGKRDQYICLLELENRTPPNFWNLDNMIKIKRLDDKVELIGRGELDNLGKHKLENKFCNTCEYEDFIDLNKESGIQVFTDKICGISQQILTKTKHSLSIEARSTELERKYEIKEEACIGLWQPDEKKFIRFSDEESLSCHLKKIHSFTYSQQKNLHYSTVIKPTLWRILFQDKDTDKTKSFLARLTQRQQGLSLESQLSIQIFQTFLNWKDLYNVRGQVDETTVKGLIRKVRPLAAQMGQQGNKELQKLNRILNEQFQLPNLTVQPEANKAVTQQPTTPTFKTDRINLKDKVRDLY